MDEVVTQQQASPLFRGMNAMQCDAMRDDALDSSIYPSMVSLPHPLICPFSSILNPLIQSIHGLREISSHSPVISMLVSPPPREAAPVFHVPRSALPSTFQRQLRASAQYEYM